MEIKIVEKNDNGSSVWMPLCYRVSLRIDREYVTLLREYFRSGFSDGESFDEFYFDNEWCGRQNSTMTRCTFITKKVDDKEYLRQKEDELIKEFYKRCIKNRDMTKKKLMKETKQLTDDIKTYEDIIRHFEYVNRGDKIEKIRNNIC